MNNSPELSQNQCQSQNADTFVSRMASLLNYDFCPSFNRWVYWMRSPLFCLLISLVISLTCGILANSNLLFVSLILFLVVGLGVVWPWIASCSLEAEITFNKQRVRCGEKVNAHLRIKNKLPIPVWGVYIKHDLSGHLNHFCQVAIEYIPPMKTSEYFWEFKPIRRGFYSTENSVLKTGFPFGLIEKSISLKVDSTLIVWPDSQILNTMPELMEINSTEGNFSKNQSGDQGDIIGVRDFRVGDSLRQVHWIQTARKNELIVTERQTACQPSTRVIPDLRMTLEDSTNENSLNSLEAIIRITASVCESLSSHQARVECVIGKETFLLGNSSEERIRFLDTLASIPESGLNCHLDSHTSGLQSQIVITTDEEFINQSVIKHVSPSQKLIIVNSQSEAENSESSCHCKPWIYLPSPEESMGPVFADHWRRACYVR